VDTYKKIEIVGTSGDSFSDAVDSAIAKAGQSVHHMGWFEVGELRGRIKDGKVDQYQVTLKIGFKLD